jgi:Mce-associated membrane protein
MTVEHDASLGTTETPNDSAEAPSPDEVGVPPACENSARVSGLAAIRRWTRRCLASWRSIVATALVVAAMGLAAGLFFFQYRPDRQIDDAAARQAIAAASDGAVVVLSYSPDHLDRDFAQARSHLTGDFLVHYNKFTEQLVTPMARQTQITQTAKVVRAAVLELHPDSAVVLVFLNQTASSKDKPEPQITPSIVRVTLTKVSGSWLISNLDPLS